MVGFCENGWVENAIITYSAIIIYSTGTDECHIAQGQRNPPKNVAKNGKKKMALFTHNPQTASRGGLLRTFSTTQLLIANKFNFAQKLIKRPISFFFMLDNFVCFPHPVNRKQP